MNNKWDNYKKNFKLFEYKDPEYNINLVYDRHNEKYEVVHKPINEILETGKSFKESVQSLLNPFVNDHQEMVYSYDTVVNNSQNLTQRMNQLKTKIELAQNEYNDYLQKLEDLKASEPKIENESVEPKND